MSSPSHNPQTDTISQARERKQVMWLAATIILLAIFMIGVRQPGRSGRVLAIAAGLGLMGVGFTHQVQRLRNKSCRVYIGRLLSIEPSGLKAAIALDVELGWEEDGTGKHDPLPDATGPHVLKVRRDKDAADLPPGTELLVRVPAPGSAKPDLVMVRVPASIATPAAIEKMGWGVSIDKPDGPAAYVPTGFDVDAAVAGLDSDAKRNET